MGRGVAHIAEHCVLQLKSTALQMRTYTLESRKHNTSGLLLALLLKYAGQIDASERARFAVAFDPSTALAAVGSAPCAADLATRVTRLSSHQILSAFSVRPLS